MRLLAVVAILQRVVDNRAKGAIVHEIAHIVVIAQALHVLHVERHGAVHILVDGAGREDPLIGIRAIGQVPTAQVVIARIGHLDSDRR